MTPTNVVTPAETSTEYGVRRAGEPRVVWPDSDGELHLDGLFRAAYGLTDTQVQGLRDAARREGGHLVERTVSKGAARVSEPPLPAVGSVARADVVSPIYGHLGRTTVVRDNSEAYPWSVAAAVHRGAGIPASGVTNVEIVFDAAA